MADSKVVDPDYPGNDDRLSNEELKQRYIKKLEMLRIIFVMGLIRWKN